MHILHPTHITTSRYSVCHIHCYHIKGLHLMRFLQCTRLYSFKKYGRILTYTPQFQPSRYLHLASDIDAIVFDCDGVIWKGSEVIPGVNIALRKLQKNGIKLFFVTNNSVKSRKTTKQKFVDLGLPFEDCTFYSSSYAAALYCARRKIASDKKVYVIGEYGLLEELENFGINWIGGPCDTDKAVDFSIGRITIDPNVEAVVVGMDTNINYYKLHYAQLCINTLGAEFIATNLDAVSPYTTQQHWPCGGAMAGAVRGCTGIEPTLVGKPSPLLIDHIIEEFHLDPTRVCMVGDRIDTDICFGKSRELKTFLTLSGVTSLEEVSKVREEHKPDFVISSVSDMVLERIF